MNIFLVLAFLFFVGSVSGFLLELLYRRLFCRDKAMINPGFLIGPYEPLYGFGLVILFLISLFDFSFIASKTLQIVFEIVIMVISMVLLEYVTGIIFIKWLKVKLWDYSDRWGNIQGIVCPAYTFLWTTIAIMYYFFIHPAIIDAVVWFTNNITFSFFIGMFFGILIIDLCYTTKFVAHIRTFAKNHDIVIRYTRLKESVVLFSKDKLEKVSRIIPFRDKLKEKLEYYKAHVYSKIKPGKTHDIGTDGDI